MQPNASRAALALYQPLTSSNYPWMREPTRPVSYRRGSGVASPVRIRVRTRSAFDRALEMAFVVGETERGTERGRKAGSPDRDGKGTFPYAFLLLVIQDERQSKASPKREEEGLFTPSRRADAR